MHQQKKQNADGIKEQIKRHLETNATVDEISLAIEAMKRANQAKSARMVPPLKPGVYHRIELG
jgi:hypothetical protein